MEKDTMEKILSDIDILKISKVIFVMVQVPCI